MARLGLIIPERRAFLGKAGTLTLSAAAVALLSGNEALAAQGKTATSHDIEILNTALGAEHQAIAAYQVGAESGLLTKPVLGVAVKFQSDHKEHADLLSKTVKKLGGKPAMAMKPADYKFPTDELKSEKDVLRFAAGLEKGAISAYLGAVPLFGNKDLAKAAASILGNEAMHWALLLQALGEPADPVAFVS
jgi:rubrerythrin